MKKATKRLVAAALAALVTTSVCATFTGCGAGNTETTAATPMATLPDNSTETTTDTTGEGTTTASSGDIETEATTTASSSSNQGQVTPPPAVMNGMNVLTGEPCVNDVSYKKPLAIVVDNSPLAIPYQTGLDQADVLYEALVAPGITRFLMVTADYTQVDKVSNIRSGRDYHLDFAAFHNAVLVCHGGHTENPVENYDFYSLVAARLGSRWAFVDTQFEAWFAHDDKGQQYGTIDKNVVRPDLNYNTIFKPDAMTALLGSTSSKFVSHGYGTLYGQARESLKFIPYGTEKDMSGAGTANNVRLSFTCSGSAGAFAVSYQYDAASGKYLRNQRDGMAHIDSETKKQLSFTNVITLFTNVKNVDSKVSSDPNMAMVETMGSGVGYYFHGGKVINITWSSDGSVLRLIDPNGEELKLATGNTYIGYLDNAYLSSLNGTPFWN